MKTKYIALAFVLALAAAFIVGLWAPVVVVHGTTQAEAAATSTPPDLAALSVAHRQETWISALEWCESRGVKTAINPVDSDGTPSYYSWQFKPGTFRWYVTKYGIAATSTSDSEMWKLMGDYQTEREVMRRMIADPKVNFAHEFPDCVKNKVGQPPRK